ncbi:MAG: cupredoxin domain-containing protein [Hyphomicrobiales bacterium]
MSRMLYCALGVVAASSLFAACGGDDDGGDRRVIEITQTDDDCTPNPIALQPGEKVKFEVHNESGKDKEVEGIEGTKLEELIIPKGKTRNLNYTAPDEPGTGKIKCYVPGGSTTIIELQVGGGGAATNGEGEEEEDGEGVGQAVTDKEPQDTVNVDLVEYKVTPDKPSVAEGPTKFVAKNTSTSQVHELAVLRVKDDGDFENMGEIEDLDPGADGEVVLDLPKGKYVLACLIVPGEEGSTVDHFKEGMRVDFEVK